MGYLESYFSLEGKTALVTGPGTGIGKGIAEALANAGADIIGTSHTSGLDETKRLIEEAGRAFTSYQLDMGSLDEVEAFAKEVLDRHQIDILVNNAGTIRREKAADFPGRTGKR